MGLIILGLWFTACGGPETGGNPRPQPTPSPTSGAFPGTAEGCPNSTVVSYLPGTANVVVQLSDFGTTIVAHVGDVVEFRFPFGHRWTGPTTSQGGLELQQPAGFAWKPEKACIWRFVAGKVGSTDLLFSGRALCNPGEMCPQYVLAFSFTIRVENGPTA